MSTIEAVIFDAGGVLHKNNSADVFADLSQELGLSQQDLDAIWAYNMPALSTGDITEAEFWAQLRQQHGTRTVDVSENLLGRAFAETIVPYNDVTKLVARFGAQGIKLAVLSNTIEPHARALTQAGVYEGFDHVLLSHQIGLRKPGPEIFQYVLSDLAVSDLAVSDLAVTPEEALFIDDDPKNVEAAQALGLQGLVFSDVDTSVAALRAMVLGKQE